MRGAVLLGSAVLAGCASPQPGVEVRTVEVPVIRVERCIAESDIPRRPSNLPKRPSSISAALDLAYAKVLEWQSYGARADGALRGCAAND